jgi:ubiquinone/menaquinone biosynthesis C-methylase UbiE
MYHPRHFFGICLNIVSKPLEYADVFTSSDQYARRFSGKTGQWLVDRQTEILHNFFSALKPQTILDVGGGHGQVANSFCNEYQVTVLGSTEDCSGQVKNAVAAGKCKFESGDIEKLKFPAASFDGVTCLRYLPHTDNWKSEIAELCRVAKHFVVVDFPPLFSFNLLTPVLYQLKKRIEGNTRTYGIFTRNEISAEFEKRGYSLYSYKAEFFFPMVIHRVLQSPALSSVIEYIPRILGLTDFFGSPALACFKKNIAT